MLFFDEDYNLNGYARVSEGTLVDGTINCGPSFIIDRVGNEYMKNLDERLCIRSNVDKYGLVKAGFEDGSGYNLFTLDGEPLIECWPTHISEFPDDDVAVLKYGPYGMMALFKLSERKLIKGMFDSVEGVKDGIVTVRVGDEVKYVHLDDVA